MPLPLRWDSRTCMCSNLSRDRIRSKPTMIFKPPWEPYNERIKQGEEKGRKRIKRENWLCETASLCKQAKWPMVILDRSRWLEDFGETRNFWTRFRPRDWEAILRLSEEKDLVYKFWIWVERLSDYSNASWVIGFSFSLCLYQQCLWSIRSWVLQDM